MASMIYAQLVVGLVLYISPVTRPYSSWLFALAIVTTLVWLAYRHFDHRPTDFQTKSN